MDHVPQHLGRHDDDAGGGVDGVVPGEQADAAGSVQLAEIGELLVGERLQWGRVIGLDVSLERQVDGVLGHDRLARAGGGGHEH